MLLTGGSGQVGRALFPLLKELGEVFAPSRSQLDLSSESSLRAAVRTFEPSIIVNAAAHTAVDRAESEPELAQRINGDAPAILAEEALRLHSLLVHYSTDYVFDGTKRTPYREDDPTGPLNVYGRTKLLGEQGVAAAGGAYFVLRTGWVYASRGRNFLLTMLRLGAEREELRVVDDQVGTPTPADSLADATLNILERVCGGSSDAYESARSLSGIYHAGCEGEVSWFQFALAIFTQARNSDLGARLKVSQVLPISTEEHPTAAQRPRYSVLSKEKIRRTFHLEPVSWQDGLARVMHQCAQPAPMKESMR